MIRHSSSRFSSGRRGVALMAVVITLAVLSILLLAITQQHVAHRQFLQHREHQLQSDWLARAGIELAVAKLLDDPTYSGGTVQVVPKSQVCIAVKNERVPADFFQVTCEARFPTDVPDSVVRSISRRFRRIVQGSQVRMEPMEPQ